jgi:acyl-coenzyme A synthetase/AMP-(fatty) acid ligase
VTAFSGPLPPSHFNMAQYVVGRAAEATPDKVALIVLDAADAPPAEAWTYGEIEDAVLRAAGGLLALGLQRGDRLLIRLENTSAFALLFFGAVAAGLVPIPASTQLTADEAAFLLDDSGAAAVALAPGFASDPIPDGVRILSPDEVADLLRHASRGTYADTAANDPAYLIYTSGTTAHPKGVLHGHRAAWGRRPMYDGWYGLTASDRVLHAGAFNWTYTLGTGLTDPWAQGATAIVYTGPKAPDVWPDLIRESGATIFASVPTLYRQILKAAGGGPLRLGALRHGLVAGETPPAGLFEAWETATGLPLYEALGMSEMSTFISSGPAAPRRPGHVGRAQPGRSIAILGVEGGTTPLAAGEEGLLAVHRSDPGLMLGYWNRPDEEAEVFRGPWFVGGDLAEVTEDGYVAHRGRANDLMKALGYRVAPQEVEAVLARAPGVAEVACAEVLVRADVSVIGAFVVPSHPGAVAPDDLLAFAAGRLAPYKCPRVVHLAEALPRTANGKIMRRALTSLLPAVTGDRS